MSAGIPYRRSSNPPPPISGTHRASSRPPPSGSRSHPDLLGSTGIGARFRPARLNAADLPADLACRFQCDGAFVGPLPVLDLSTTGVAAELMSERLVLAPGSELESFELILGDRVIWSGEAAVVHGGDGRLGARFTSGVLDLEHLRLEATIEGRMAILEEQKLLLPPAWRAAVADLRHLLEGVRAELEEVEMSEARDPMRRGEQESVLFARLGARWGTAYYQAVANLHEMSRGFEGRTNALACAYASSMLMPLLMACPIHRRAYEKPLGYAGDSRMMELLCTEELSGEGVFGRFLHLTMQNYTLGCTVRTRQVVMRDAVRSAMESEGERPVRVLAVAAGPAIELRRLLEETVGLKRPVQFILLDQDPSAHETAHNHLTRILLERHRGVLPVSVQCLHFSVRQLLKPQTPEDHSVRDGLGDLDLVYSAGLYDYLPDLVAQRLTSVLYSRLRPGGRLLLGNMVETPDTTWILHFVLGWPLLYRSDEAMLRLAQRLSPVPASVGITRDSTERCIFLDVTKSLEEA
jgi:extracellular factor (EF) 3-hydroxypalmitic acid methyl ester biosynthesis protein